MNEINEKKKVTDFVSEMEKISSFYNKINSMNHFLSECFDIELPLSGHLISKEKEDIFERRRV